MQKHNAKEEYLNTISEQIRWKRARKPLLYELESHIIDRRDSLIQSGVDETEAEAIAVAEMGNAEAVGLELDRVHRPRPNWLLIGSAAALFVFGLLLLWSIGGTSVQFSRMVIYGGIGIGFLVLGYFCDYTFFAKYSIPIFAALCAVCFVSPFIGSLFFYTSSQLCYALPFAYSMLLFNPNLKHRLLTISVCAVLCIAVSFVQVNISEFFYVFLLLSIILIYAALKGLTNKNRFKSFIPVLCIFGILTTILLFLLSNDALGHLQWRLDGLLNPEADPYASGWIPLRLRELLDTSVFIGSGESSEYTRYFMQNTDFTNVEFTLAAASHKYGYVLFFAVGILLAVFIGIIIYGIRKQSCKLGKLTLLTIGSSFAIRTVAYMICNLGFNLISFNGIPLFSYNGKLMILDMFMVGILLSVFRMESIARDSIVHTNKLMQS